MQSNKIFGVAIIAWMFFANICYAAVGKNLSLEFFGETATFNYSEAPWKGEFAGIDLYTCERAATRKESNAAEKCTLYQKSQKQTSGIGTVSGAGLHLVEFYLPKKAFLGDKINKQVVYSQYIAIFPASNAEVSQLAMLFSPKFSFYKNSDGTKEESYFPVSIGDLFTRNFNDIEDREFQDGLRDISDTDSLLDILSFNGSTENKISLDKSVTKAIKGSKDNFPVYWFHQKNGDELWITYFVLYAFDEKYDEYLSGRIGASIGSHSIDRESVTIKFTKNGGSYIPQQVIYAGHLEDQPTTFLGCLIITDCSSKGSLNARWENGKTTVNWSNASRYGNNPIVYVAHGSHAMKPAYGWYHLRVDTLKCLKIGCDVTEPAGNSVASNISNGSLIAVDFEKPEFRPLTYSGFLIKGGDDWYRIFPFVRFPVDKWASTSNTVFNDCVANKQGCEKYINQPTQPTPSLSINFDSASLTALGASESGGFRIEPGRPGSTTTAGKFFGVSNPGHIRIPNSAAIQFTTEATYDMWIRLDSNIGMTGHRDSSTTNWAMALLAKSHDSPGVSFSLAAPDPNSPGSGYGFAHFQTYDQSWACSTPATIRNPGSSANGAEWFRLTTTISSTAGYKIYHNKKLIWDCPNVRPSFSEMNGQDLYIGQYSDYWYPFHGAIQDVRIYKKALTDFEIQALQ